MQLAATRLSAPLASFSYRATKPLFDTAPFTLTARETTEGLDLALEDEHGDTTMSAKAAA
jgi:hydroxyacyl-ACP dehydratase HTD2-like protein with hotdog domain